MAFAKSMEQFFCIFFSANAYINLAAASHPAGLTNLLPIIMAGIYILTAFGLKTTATESGNAPTAYICFLSEYCKQINIF
jgi:hypothetical protein